MMRASTAALMSAAWLCVALPSAAADFSGSPGGLAEIGTLKAAFDIKEGDARALLYRLQIIDETRAAIIEQGATPEFVIAFRGPATRLVQTDLRELEPDERLLAGQIAFRIAQLGASPGVQSVEQCAVAVRDQGTKAENVLPPIRVVGNAWVSLIAYQAKGYAYIAP